MEWYPPLWIYINDLHPLFHISHKRSILGCWSGNSSILFFLLYFSSVCITSWEYPPPFTTPYVIDCFICWAFITLISSIKDSNLKLPLTFQFHFEIFWDFSWIIYYTTVQDTKRVYKFCVWFMGISQIFHKIKYHKFCELYAKFVYLFHVLYCM